MDEDKKNWRLGNSHLLAFISINVTKEFGREVRQNKALYFRLLELVEKIGRNTEVRTYI